LILPPHSLGILGSGQLGRMFTQEAIKLGYTVHVYSPEKNSPACKAGAIEWTGSYIDFPSLRRFLDTVSGLSFEFENIPEECLDFINDYSKSRDLNFLKPNANSIKIAQDRILEKQFFNSIGLNTVLYLPIVTGEEDFSQFPMPAILKTTRFGYDGKGQWKFNTSEELKVFLHENPPSNTLKYILEAYYPYDYEISVIYARNQEGKEFIFPPALNFHRNSILDMTEFPAPIPENIHNLAISSASLLGKNLDYAGVFGLEFFVSGDELVVNEFAPRPHNSGHYTQNGSDISQFELQLRILTGMDLPERNTIKPCLMKNLLGDDYSNSLQLCLELMSKDSRYHLHLYQKDEAKPGRKMGHINFVGKKSEVDKRFFNLT
jgi:5-(carboxyamino)imidazole ribonucleotide synthase